MLFQYHKRLYREWGQIKEEAKEEEKARLKEKVRLQRELIIAQEHLSQVRKQEEEEELTKVSRCWSCYMISLFSPGLVNAKP